MGNPTIEKILKFNSEFVKEKKYEKFNTTKFPNKKIAILSCMDTRLTELLPAALGLQNGDVKMIKNAGALISSPFGSVVRSLIVAIYELGVNQIYVINHYDCGMQNTDTKGLIEKMIERGIDPHEIELINYLGKDLNQWLKGFEDPETSVVETVKLIKKHPLIPKTVTVAGFLIRPDTGELNLIEETV